MPYFCWKHFSGVDKDKCKAENETLEAQLNELQEQVDAALGAEEMVENLTTKCLDLEDKYRYEIQ